MRTLKRVLPVALVPLFLAGAAPARAQDNAATVEALFDAGKKLMAEGKVGEACPKFLSSYSLEPRLGTLLNLADCYERNGQAASAWARFVEATTLATRANQPERAAFASQHAKAFEGKLSTLVVSVPTAAPGEKVTRDGVTVDAAVYGVAVPVDGGKHVILATAPGKKDWTSEVTLAPTGDRQTLAIPDLADAPASVSVAAPAAATPAPANGGSTKLYAGIGTAAAGVVMLGVGSVFGVLALGKNKDSDPNCNIGGVADNCNSTGVSQRSSAVTDGTVSTVFIGVGAAAVVGGGILWLTGRSSHASTTVGFDGRSLLLTGRF